MARNFFSIHFENTAFTTTARTHNWMMCLGPKRFNGSKRQLLQHQPNNSDSKFCNKSSHTQYCTLNSAKTKEFEDNNNKKGKKKQNTSTSPLRTRTLCVGKWTDFRRQSNTQIKHHELMYQHAQTHTRTAAPNHPSCFQVQHLIRLDGEERKKESLFLFWFTFNSTLLQVDESSCSSCV